MSDTKPSIFHRFFDRVFPSMPDFFGLLTEQALQVRDGVALLVQLIETADPEIGNEIRREEHEADKTKLRNLQILNESFATPEDREDIYRAVVNLDEILNYCKTTVYQMYEFELTPNVQLNNMHTIRREGGHTWLVIKTHPRTQRRQRRQAVKRATIEIMKTQCLRDPRRDRTLAGSRGTVDGDDRNRRGN